jgi:hypothetical protein
MSGLNKHSISASSSRNLHNNKSHPIMKPTAATVSYTGNINDELVWSVRSPTTECRIPTEPVKRPSTTSITTKHSTSSNTHSKTWPRTTLQSYH